MVTFSAGGAALAGASLAAPEAAGAVDADDPEAPQAPTMIDSEASRIASCLLVVLMCSSTFPILDQRSDA
jgi:hypothetical protein